MVNLANFQLQELLAVPPVMQGDMGKRMTGLVYFKGDGKWVMLMGWVKSERWFMKVETEHSTWRRGCFTSDGREFQNFLERMYDSPMS